MTTTAAPPAISRAVSAAVLAACLAVLGCVGVQPATAAAAGVGWIRLAHLSPDTPGMDVRLMSFDAATPDIMLENVTFGAVSDYQRLPAGFYTLSMVPPGSAADATPVLTTSVEIAAGASYTSVAVGRRAELMQKVFADDLTPPPAGQARVRVIHAASAVPTLAAAGTDGVDVAPDTPFGTAAPYATVPAGPRTIEVTPGSGDAQPVTTDVDLAAGSISTLLVLDDPAGFVVRTLVDSIGMSRMPVGGADTGYGPSAGGSLPPYGYLALIALAGTGVLLARSRNP